MNLDHFGSYGAATSSPADAASDAALVDVPAPILALERIYRAELALRTHIEEEVESLHGQLQDIVGRGLASVTIGGRAGVAMGLEQLQIYAQRVDRIAARELSRPGAPFTKQLYGSYSFTRSDDYAESFHSDPDRQAAAKARLYNHFSPVAMWHELRRHFDPAAQQAAQSAWAARRIRIEFGMNEGKPPAMAIVGGRVEVTVDPHVFKNSQGVRHLGPYSKLPELGDALHQSMLDAGSDAMFGKRLGELARELMSKREVVSRERVQLGDGVDIVMGFQNFKLYMPQHIANLVNIFLAEQPASN